MDPETICRNVTWALDFCWAISPAAFLAFVAWVITE